MKLIHNIFIILSLIFLSFFYINPVNAQIINGNFTDGYTGWTLSEAPNEYLTLYGYWYYSSPYSMLIRFNYRWISQTVDLSGYDNLTFWYHAPSSSPTFFVSIDGVQKGSYTPYGAAQQGKIDVSGYEGEYNILFHVSLNGRVDLDDVNLEGAGPPVLSEINWYPDVDQTNTTAMYDVQYDCNDDYPVNVVTYYSSQFINGSWTDYVVQNFHFVDNYDLCSDNGRCWITNFPVTGSGTMELNDVWTTYIYNTVKWKVVLSDPFGFEIVDYDEIIYSQNYTYDDYYNDTVPPISDPTPVPTPTYTPVPIPTPGTDENISVNTSFSGEYYDFIDGAMSGFQSALDGIENLTSFPIDGFTILINNVSGQFESIDGDGHKWILLEIVPPLIDAIPNSIKGLITVGFIFTLILIVMGRTQ